jgi:hypothetical protein
MMDPPSKMSLPLSVFFPPSVLENCESSVEAHCLVFQAGIMKVDSFMLLVTGTVCKTLGLFLAKDAMGRSFDRRQILT